MQESCVNRAVPPFPGNVTLICEHEVWVLMRWRWRAPHDSPHTHFSDAAAESRTSLSVHFKQRRSFLLSSFAFVIRSIIRNPFYSVHFYLLSAFGLIMPGLKLSGALILWVLMLPFSRPNSQVLDCREVRSSFQFLYPGMKWTPETPVSGKQSYRDHHKLIQLSVWF